jgi:hypothetical protein
VLVRFLSALSLLFIVAICNPISTADSLRGQSYKWQLTFQLSGGLAGFHRSLAVSSSGDFVAEDHQRGIKVAGKATPKDLAVVNSSLAAIKAAPGDRRNSKCRDCLIYDFILEDEGARFLARIDDTTLPASGLGDVTAVLSTLLNRTLSTK